MIIRFLLIFLVSIPVLSAEELNITAQQWLEKMSHAKKVLSYHGTVIFYKNGQLDAMKYSHAADKELEQERLLSLNSPLREIIREAGRVRCTYKNIDKSVINHHPVSQSFIVDLPVNFSEVTGFYHFDHQNDESIAMKLTHVISIKSKDNYRYNRKIWIDKQSFLPLKIEVFNQAGYSLEQIFFTDIQMSNKNNLMIGDAKTNVSTTKQMHQAVSLSFSDADFMLNNIPEGFKTVFFAQMKVENTEQSVDHLLLSDGFSSISIYKELKADDSQIGLQTLGSVNSYTHSLGRFNITAMGEVPAKTVQFIAQGAVLR